MTRAPVPLQRKLSAFSLMTCGIALLITLLMFLAGEMVVARQAHLQQLRVLSEAIASNSTAALAFDNADDARGILEAFRSDPNIEVAALYDTRGELFATFPPTLPAGVEIPLPREPGYRFVGSRLIGVASVREGDMPLGSLVVRASMRSVYERLGAYALLAAAIIALALLAAWWVSRRLQKQLAAPILSLASTAETVSSERDYSVRASLSGIRELDMLTGAFNHMLTQTGQYEARLNTQLSRLALLQQITHSIGSRHDLLSIFQVVLGTLEQHLPIHFGCVCLRDAVEDTIVVEAVGPASGPLAQALGLEARAAVAVGENGLYRALHGALIYEPDVAASSSPFPRRFAEAGLHSLVLAPLALESSVFGVLVTARREPNSFSSADCEFLKQLSEHVALASHQAQLYVALQRAYEDLRLSQQTVLQAERLRALGQMASGIAHDINNAISPISLYTELLLQQETAISAKGRDRLVTMQRAIEDVAGTIDRMREFYRPRESARDFAKVDVHALIRQVVELTRPRWQALPQQRGIVIDLRQTFAPDSIELLGDDVELRDALTNLIFNAVDSMPGGGALTLATRIRKGADGTSLPVIEVTDTGIGMDEETRRRCIEPFFTTKGERGTGLGLASVYGMLQRHDAELEIDSAPGQGTTVRMVFPALVMAEAVARTLSPSSAVRRNLRILLIDDDPVLMRSLQDALEADSHRLLLAPGGQAGIDVFRDSSDRGETIDLVITDLGMPRVDGRKVAAAIKALAPAVPIILLTGWGQRLIDEGDLPAHIDRVLSKPPRLMQLRAAIAELVALRP